MLGARLEGTLPLPPETAHYLNSVRRLPLGAPLILFDGEGNEVDAELLEGAVRCVGPARAGLSGAALTLCYALPKGDKLERVVRQATELGVGRIALVQGARSVVRLQGDRARKRLQRLERVASEAARQCGRADTPELCGPLDLVALDTLTEDCHSRLLLHPEGGLGLGALELGAPAALFVGPEGGFAPEELSQLAHWTRLTLAGPVLRTETAATVGCALVLARLGVL